MKFPPDIDREERRNMEFLPEEFVEKINKAKLRLDRHDEEVLKKIFLDIEKFKENNEEEDNEFNKE